MRGNYESLATVSRLFCHPLAMSVAKQSQSSEIGALYNPFTPIDPRRPLYMLCMYVTTVHCTYGILSRGDLKQTESHQFQLSNDKRHLFIHI